MWRNKLNSRIGTVVALVAVFVCGAVAVAGKPGGGGTTSPSYTIVKLDDVGGTVSGNAFDINDSRLIVGGAGQGDVAFAVYWTVTAAGRTINSTLHFLNGGEIAFGCNEAGEIVGVGDDAAMYWANTGATGQVLPVLDGDMRSGAEAISNDGVICGWSQSAPDATGKRRSSAVAWRVTQGPDGPEISPPLELNTLGSVPEVTDFSVGKDVSDQDAEGLISIVGESNFNATVWTVTLDGSGGLVAETTDRLSASGSADGTNNSGVVCGRADLDLATENTEAVTWTDGVGRLLGLGGFNGVAQPRDINDGKVVIGEAYSYSTRSSQAVVWAGPNATMVQLSSFLKNSPFGSLTGAQAVSESGEIVGQGKLKNQDFYPAFLAIPK